jgi:hypothetical protein
MKIKLFLTVGIVVFLFIGCSEKKKYDLPVDFETIYFSSLKQIEKNIPYDLAKKKKYIKLDNSDQFLFRGIDKVKIVDNNIYVLDKRLNKLIVFDIMGNGVANLNKLGQGAEEYLQITDFDVNPLGDMYILDGRLDKLFVYDKFANFVSVNVLPFEADIVHLLPDNKLLFGLSSWNKGESKSKKIAVTDIDLKIERTYLNYDEFVDEAYWISSYNFIPTTNYIFYNKQIDNVVYALSLSDGIPQKAYVFDFEKKNVPDKNKKDIEGTLRDFESFCCLKNFAVVNDEYALGTVWDKLQTKAFILDRKKQILYISKATTDNDKSNIAGIYENYIISFITPEKCEYLNNEIPIDIKEYVEDGNFVISLYTLS